LPQHPRSIQTFDNDPAVGFSQSCCQDMQMVGADIVDPAVQPGDLDGAFTVAPRVFRAARSCPRNLTVFQRFRITRRDGFAVSIPVSCHASISPFKVATAQLYVLRRAPKCRDSNLT
jgi:hypothetical protein